MDLTRLESYAQGARQDFITAVKARAATYGITKSGFAPLTESHDFVLIRGRHFPREILVPRERLRDWIRQNGFDHVIDEVAYTWFNRLAALRYMELHGFLSGGMRILSHPDGHHQPEMLQHAHEVDLPSLDRSQVISLMLDPSKEEALYRMLLLAQCKALSRSLPQLFGSNGDVLELLLPCNLLRTNSLTRKLVDKVDESDWQSVEVIGWLYQFYISEKKVATRGRVVEPEDIPAATQIFTPKWITKYMVQNSLGATWLTAHPESSIADRMEFYIEPTPPQKHMLYIILIQNHSHFLIPRWDPAMSW